MCPPVWRGTSRSAEVHQPRHAIGRIFELPSQLPRKSLALGFTARSNLARHYS